MLTLYLSLISTEAERSRFEEVYSQCRKQMIVIATSILKNEDDAEDVVHDVFYSIASSDTDILEKLDNPQDLKNYMFKATQNRAISMIRRRKVQRDSENKFINFNLELNDSEFVDNICDKFECESLLRAIQQLDSKYREVLYYHFVLNLSVAETAETVGRPQDTVYKQLYRGKKKLEEILIRGDSKYVYDAKRV